MDMLWFLTGLMLLVVVLAALALVFDWQLAANAKAMWKWWSVRLQAICALITGWLFFDPAAMLYAFNLLPNHVRAAMPEDVAQAVSWAGGMIFALNVMTIVARGVDQPKARK